MHYLIAPYLLLFLNAEVNGMKSLDSRLRYRDPQIANNLMLRSTPRRVNAASSFLPTSQIEVNEYSFPSQPRFNLPWAEIPTSPSTPFPCFFKLACLFRPFARRAANILPEIFRIFTNIPHLTVTLLLSKVYVPGVYTTHRVPCSSRRRGISRQRSNEVDPRYPAHDSNVFHLKLVYRQHGPESTLVSKYATRNWWI